MSEGLVEQLRRHKEYGKMYNMRLSDAEWDGLIEAVQEKDAELKRLRFIVDKMADQA